LLLLLLLLLLVVQELELVLVSDEVEALLGRLDVVVDDVVEAGRLGQVELDRQQAVGVGVERGQEAAPGLVGLELVEGGGGGIGGAPGRRQG